MSQASASSPSPVKTPKPKFSFLRFRLRTLMLVVTLSCFGVWGKLQYDWYCKLSLAAKWVEPLVQQKPLAGDMPASDYPWDDYLFVSQLPTPPPRISAQEELELLELAILRLSRPKQRMAGLKILAETRKEEVFPILRSLLAKSRHPEIVAALVHLICLQRNAADVPEFVRLLDHPEATVRAAAADALGYIHLPTSLHSREDYWREQRQSWLNVEPPINIQPLLGVRQSSEAIGLDPPVRVRLEQMMLTGTTDIERTAAAGALVNWPPEKAQFRYAEWGVWLDDGGELKLLQSVLDEIPPFVHQTGNRLSEFRNRVTRIMAITKPVVHITADRPMAIDLEIQIRQGRPWYAYPRPDDFAFEPGTIDGLVRENANGEIGVEIGAFRSLERLDPPNLTPLAPLAEGYAWRLPKHRSIGSGLGSMVAMGNEVASMGVRWQSLIVTPHRESWMLPPEVGADPKFGWWKALREVPSSWVSSHGETERFLYYDGPSFARSPITVCSDGKMLWLRTQPMIERQENFHFEIGPDGRKRTARTGFLVDVSDYGVATQSFAIPGPAGSELEVEVSPIMGAEDDAIRRLLALLVKAGLTTEEAGGLIASWRKQFFETSGRRLLTILSREDYDEVCPIRIRPDTTQSARVGIVLTELAE